MTRREGYVESKKVVLGGEDCPHRKEVGRLQFFHQLQCWKRK